MLTGHKIRYETNALTQVMAKTVAERLTENYYFVCDATQKKTTNMVSGKKNTVNGQEVENFGYTYDANWNITQVKDSKSNKSVDYTYDTQGQLLTATHKTGNTVNRTEKYTYDTYGNIRSFNNGTTSHSYTYGDAEWKDLLTAVDGHALTYDEIGNPLSYYNGTSYTMDWSDGRKLTTLKKGGSSYTYKYDLNGIRSWKIGPDGKHKYIIVDGKAVGEMVWDANDKYLYNLRYTFDETGAVCGISQIKPGEEIWTKFYFTKNLQGDVTGVYRANTDSTGIPSFTPVATYTYDSWGNVLTKSGEMADVNPFRYRGYYQDNETGFYYLQSRYYDPSIGRFINGDAFASTGQGFLGYNTFAYCNNNPITQGDPTGESAILLTLGIMAVGGVIGAGISAASSAITQKLTTGTVNWKSVGVAAGTGFVSGAVAASPLGLTGQKIAGGIIGGISYAADCYVNDKAMRLDEAAISVGMGIVSGRIGGPGANEDMFLTNAAESARKGISRELRRSNQDYAAKMIDSISREVKNAFAVTAWSASIRFSAGCGISNGITNWYASLDGRPNMPSLEPW